MSERIIMLKERLEKKQKRLEAMQMNFWNYVDDGEMHMSCFESNSINNLLEMQKLKAEICELKFVLSLLED